MHSSTLNLTRCFALCLLLSALLVNGFSQTRRSPVRSTKPAPTAEPEFDTLLAADSYNVYGEVRGVGQLLRSSSVNELLEPLIKWATPPKELKSLIKWLNTHSDSLTTARLLVAAWPTHEGLPELVVALEFPSADDAAKFAPELNDFLGRVLPKPNPSPSPSSTAAKVKAPVSPPSYYLKRSGPLVLITPGPFNLKNLRPPGSRALSEEPNFRVAHDRFINESIFLYANLSQLNHDEKQAQQAEETTSNSSPTNEQSSVDATPAAPDPEPVPSPVETTEQAVPYPAESPVAVESAQDDRQKPPDPIDIALNALSSTFFSTVSKWPQALGVAIAVDDASLDARVLMINSPGEKSDAVPFLPLLIPGPPISPESPAILPSDTELMVTMSLDFEQLYNGLTRTDGRAAQTTGISTADKTEETRFTVIEKKLGFKIKDDLLPILGAETVFTMPVTTPTPKPPATTDKGSNPPAGIPSPVIALSLKDKEKMRALLPRVIDAIGFKGASAFARTERREDTELVSYANSFAYAYVGNFLVLSADVSGVRHVVDSYLKSETLAADPAFKNYTRWHPRQLQAQVYVSPALMDSYKKWFQTTDSMFGDPTRDLLARLSVISQPVTYSLSNDGLGYLHELHVPKNLVLMAISGLSADSSPPPQVANERAALSALHMLSEVEAEYRKENENGEYGTMDQLQVKAPYLRKLLPVGGYKIDLSVSGLHFEISAVPVEYGTTGRMSYFVDESLVVRGADRGGAAATSGDNPVGH